MSPSRGKVEKHIASNEAMTFGGWAKSYFDFKADPKSGDEQLAEPSDRQCRSRCRLVAIPSTFRSRCISRQVGDSIVECRAESPYIAGPAGTL